MVCAPGGGGLEAVQHESSNDVSSNDVTMGSCLSGVKTRGCFMSPCRHCRESVATPIIGEEGTRLRIAAEQQHDYGSTIKAEAAALDGADSERAQKLRRESDNAQRQCDGLHHDAAEATFRHRNPGGIKKMPFRIDLQGLRLDEALMRLHGRLETLQKRARPGQCLEVMASVQMTESFEEALQERKLMYEKQDGEAETILRVSFVKAKHIQSI